jgi:PAS domain S-box-containing protein
MAERPIIIVHGRPDPDPELADRVRRLGYDVLAITESHEAEGEAAAGDGHPVVVDLSSDEDVAAAFTDRELRARVELAVCLHDQARSAHDLDAFFTVSIDMFCFLDFSGYFKRLNPAWERTLGFTRAELMSRPFIEFVHPDDRQRTLGQNAQVRGGGQALSFENRYMHRDGSHRWLRWNSTPRSEEGVIYAVARDVTAEKLAEEERSRLLGELRASLAEVKTLQEILPICSHCRKIRDDEDYWHSVEGYIAKYTNSSFSHGICPDCVVSVYGADYL